MFSWKKSFFRFCVGKKYSWKKSFFRQKIEFPIDKTAKSEKALFPGIWKSFLSRNIFCERENEFPIDKLAKIWKPSFSRNLKKLFFQEYFWWMAKVSFLLTTPAKSEKALFAGIWKSSLSRIFLMNLKLSFLLTKFLHLDKLSFPGILISSFTMRTFQCGALDTEGLSSGQKTS